MEQRYEQFECSFVGENSISKKKPKSMKRTVQTKKIGYVRHCRLTDASMNAAEQ
jgi:hypothetical protein